MVGRRVSGSPSCRSRGRQARPEPLHINPVVPDGIVGQPEEQLAVHLGEPRQFEPAEQIVGVVDGAVVGADDVPGPDRVVVSVDPIIPAGSPAGVTNGEVIP